MVDDTHVGPEYFTNREENELDWADRTHGFWTIHPSENTVLLLFVHGWGGNALTTWEQSLTLCPPEWGGHDFVFYGYKSRKFQAENHAGNLLHFLNNFLSDTSTWINSSIRHLIPTFPHYQRPPTFSYSRIVVVAHSLGAIVARRAFLEEASELLNFQDSWLRLTRLVLFAPAHNGSPWADGQDKLLPSLLGKLGALLNGVNIIAMPSILSLSKNSDTIVDLKKDTQAILDKGYRAPFKASKIVFGDGENVVYASRFPGDPRSEIPPYQNRNHVNVCKPFPGWPNPLELIERAINER